MKHKPLRVSARRKNVDFPLNEWQTWVPEQGSLTNQLMLNPRWKPFSIISESTFHLFRFIDSNNSLNVRVKCIVYMYLALRQAVSYECNSNKQNSRSAYLSRLRTSKSLVSAYNVHTYMCIYFARAYPIIQLAIYTIVFQTVVNFSIKS